MASFAGAGDMEMVWRPLTPAEGSVADELLLRASALLRSRVPNIDERITSGDLDPNLATMAVIEMVKRVLRNPEGLRSENTGPFGATFDLQLASGRLMVTADDLAMVSPPARRRVRNIALYPRLR